MGLQQAGSRKQGAHRKRRGFCKEELLQREEDIVHRRCVAILAGLGGAQEQADTPGDVPSPGEGFRRGRTASSQTAAPVSVRHGSIKLHKGGRRRQAVYSVKDGVKVQIADGLACPKFDVYNVKQERKRRPPQTSIRKRRPTKNMISISKYKLHWNNQNGVFC